MRYAITKYRTPPVVRSLGTHILHPHRTLSPQDNRTTSVTYLRDGVKASAVRCRLEKKGRPVDTGSPELLHEPTDPELRGPWIGARTKRKTQHNSFKLNKGKG